MIEMPRRRRDRSVSELPPDDPDVHALTSQLRRVSVPEIVGVNALLDPDPRGKPRKEAADVRRRRGAADCVQNSGASGGSSIRRRTAIHSTIIGIAASSIPTVRDDPPLPRRTRRPH